MIKSSLLELTPSIKQYIEEKFNDLDRFLEQWKDKDAIVVPNIIIREMFFMLKLIFLFQGTIYVLKPLLEIFIILLMKFIMI